MLNFDNVPKLTREQAAILSAYTGIVFGPFDDMHAYAQHILKTKIEPQQYSYDFSMIEKLAVASKEDAIKICVEVTEGVWYPPEWYTGNGKLYAGVIERDGESKFLFPVCKIYDDVELLFKDDRLTRNWQPVQVRASAVDWLNWDIVAYRIISHG